jgi:hypothetical protein
MSDWMENLKKEVDVSVEKQQARADEIQRQDLSVRNATAALYERVHESLKFGERTKFNSTVLKNDHSKIEIRYPEDVVNAGTFWLDLGPFRYAVTLEATEPGLIANLSAHGSKKVLPVPSGTFSVRTEGNGLMINRSNGAEPTTAEGVIRELLANLYRFYRGIG